MKNHKRVLNFAVFSSLIYSVEAQTAQNVGSSFMSNLKSGAIGENIKNILDSELVLWLAFFAFFGYVIKYGIEKAWPTMKSPQKGGMAIAMSTVLTYGLIKSNITQTLPRNLVLGTILTLVIAFGLNSMKDKDGKPKIGFGPAILIGLLIGGLVVGGLTYLSSKESFSIGSIFGGKTSQSEIQSRIIAGGTTGATSNDPNVNWELGNQALKRYDYANARKYFSLVVAAGPGTYNPHYRDAGDYIGPEKDILFRKMIVQYAEVIDYEIAAIANLRQAARETANADEKQRLNKKADDLVLVAQQQIAEACREAARRGRACKT